MTNYVVTAAPVGRLLEGLAHRVSRTKGNALNKIAIALVGIGMVVGCAEKDAPTTKPPVTIESATARPLESAAPTSLPSPGVPSTTDVPPAARKCDVDIVPGERIGDERLGGGASKSVQLEKEPKTKTYCVLGMALSPGDKLADVEPELQKRCAWTKTINIGATIMQCPSRGVALIFGGPPSVFSAVEVFPKGAPPKY